MEPTGRATIHEVARLADVSTATVSRALSGSRPVNPDTVRKVEAAAARLGYRVDPLGRSLRRQKTGTIGLVVANIVNPFFASLIAAVEDAARRSHNGVLIADAGDDPDRERDAVDRLADSRVDALFIAPCDRIRSRSTVANAASRVPTIQLDRFASTKAHYVGMDNELAVSDLLDLLRSQGRRSFAFVGSDSHVSTAWERQRAFSRLASAMDSGASARVLTGDFSHAWGRSAAHAIVDTWPGVDAIVCASDLIALGVVDGLASRRRVPEDVAVTGFDDTMFATLKDPTLTSVHQPLDEMARAAVSLALTLGPGLASPARRTFPGWLVQRTSSAAGYPPT